MGELLPSRAGRAVLDIGTGTGIVAAAMADGGPEPRLIAGCDRSLAMLGQAQKRLPRLRVLASDVTALPLPSNSFDMATASFVISHVRDYHRALFEFHRILKPGGWLAVSSWAEASDPYGPAWNECLANVISNVVMAGALAEVAPAEEALARPGALEGALRQAGFAIASQETLMVESTLTVEQFLRDRAISSSGRLAQHLLDAAAWRQFCAAAREALLSRFGSAFAYRRIALILVGRRA
jgi:ubiquinone/menaquinone biosynthesis C-methylase UbiE